MFLALYTKVGRGRSHACVQSACAEQASLLLTKMKDPLKDGLNYYFFKNLIKTPKQKTFFRLGASLYLTVRVTFTWYHSGWNVRVEREQQLTSPLIQGTQSICHWHFWVSSAYSAYLNGVCSHFLLLCEPIYHYLPNIVQCHAGMETLRPRTIWTFFVLHSSNIKLIYKRKYFEAGNKFDATHDLYLLLLMTLTCNPQTPLSLGTFILSFSQFFFYYLS